MRSPRRHITPRRGTNPAAAGVLRRGGNKSSPRRKTYQEHHVPDIYSRRGIIQFPPRRMYSSPRRELAFAAARLLQRLLKRCRKVSPRRKLYIAAARTSRVTSPRRCHIFAATRRFWVTLAAARIWFRRGEDPTTLILSVVESSRRGEKYTSPRRDPTTLRSVKKSEIFKFF